MEYNLNKEPKEYLINNNLLYFREKPLSLYRQAYEKFIEDTVGNIGIIDRLRSIEISALEDIEYIKERFFDKGIRLIVPTHVSMLKYEYKAKGGKFPQGDNTYHFVNLFDIDEKNKKAFIMDPYFGFKGKIDLELFYGAVFNSINGYPEGKIYYLNLSIKPDLSEKNALMFNLNLYKQDKVLVDNVPFTTSLKAIENFMDDMDDILESFYSRFGEFSSQFLSFQLIPIRLQKSSLHLLYARLQRDHMDIIDNEIVELFHSSSKLWNKLDLVFDLIFLRGQNVLTERKRIKQCLTDILQNEYQIVEKVSSIVM